MKRNESAIRTRLAAPLKLYKHAKMNHVNHYYGQNMDPVFARHNDYAIAVQLRAQLFTGLQIRSSLSASCPLANIRFMTVIYSKSNTNNYAHLCLYTYLNYGANILLLVAKSGYAHWILHKIIWCTSLCLTQFPISNWGGGATL